MRKHGTKHATFSSLKGRQNKTSSACNPQPPINAETGVYIGGGAGRSMGRKGEVVRTVLLQRLRRQITATKRIMWSDSDRNVQLKRKIRKNKKNEKKWKTVRQ